MQNKLKLTAKEQESLLDWVSERKALRKWCQDNKHHHRTVTEYLRDEANAHFAKNYALAFQDGLDSDVEKMREYALDPNLDGDQRRAAIDVIKWSAEKLNPRKYANKVAIGGADDLGPVNMVTVLQVVGIKAKKK